MKIKHIFFDLDHTLWDFETNSTNTFNFIFAKNKIGIDFVDFQDVYKGVNEKYWKLYREDKVSKSQLRYSRLKDTFDGINFEIDDKTIHLLSEEYIEYLANYNALFNGTIEILEYLKPNYKLHIITNGFEEVQLRKLKNSQIKSYFLEIICSEKVGVKKPNPVIFDFAMAAAGAKPEESIMIGDNLEADIMGAQDAGMQTIFCEFNGELPPEGIITISKLDELKQYL